MMQVISAKKCMGKDAGKMVQVYVEKDFEYKTCDNAHATFTCPGKLKNGNKVTLIVSIPIEDYKEAKDVASIRWFGRSYYAYDA